MLLSVQSNKVAGSVPRRARETLSGTRCLSPPPGLVQCVCSLVLFDAQSIIVAREQNLDSTGIFVLTMIGWSLLTSTCLKEASDSSFFRRI